MSVAKPEDGVERELTWIDYGNPAWSPDGREIAFVRCDESADEACAVFAVPADGGAPRRVTQNGLYGQPIWSPDGRRLAFETMDHGIVVVAADGSDRMWSTSKRFDGDPVWSPDGTQIAFVRTEHLPQREVRHDVNVISADGTGTYRVTDGLTSAADPAWSPDGKQIVFAKWAEDGAFECPSAALFAAAPDGSNTRRLTPYRQLHADPAWSPDGREIAFARIEECWSEEGAVLYVLSIRGGTARAVSPTARVEAGLDFAWRPSPGLD